MRTITTGILMLVALVFATVLEVQSPPAPQSVSDISFFHADENAGREYSVVRVIDGDTVIIEKDGVNETVRLIGLDTPETVDPRTPVQCFGQAASEEAKRMLAGTRVRIETDPSQDVRDKYDRLLAYVYVDEILFNQYMIAYGFGHEYTYNIPYTYQAEFKSAEAAARADKRGLWADDACAEYNTFTPVTETAWTLPLPFASGEYECSRNTYSCKDFSKQAEAQRVFELCGGTKNDVHLLDGDRDGRVCESLP